MPLRYLAVIVLLALVSPFIGFCSWDRVESWRVSSRLSAIERAGEPLRIDTAASETPETPDQKLASRYYGEAARLSLDAHGPRFIEAGTIMTALSALPPAEAARDARVETLRATQALYDRALDLLDLATRLDARGFAPADRPKSVMDERFVANPNAIRVARLSFAGDAAGAGRALLGTLRLRRMYSIYWRRSILPTAHALTLVLNAGPVPSGDLEALQREYAAIEADLDVAQQVVNDRARFMRVMIPADVGGMAAETTNTGRPGPFEALAYRMLRPMRRHSIVSALDDYDEALAASRQPWPAKLDATDALVRRKGGTAPGGRRSFLQQVNAPWGRNVGTRLLAGIVAGSAEGLACVRAAASALAIARYERDHPGELPPNLEALVPKYLPAVSQDPFSGTALRFVRNGTAYKVYSVGANRKDDGGRWFLASDLLPRRGNPEDLGIAVAMVGIQPDDVAGRGAALRTIRARHVRRVGSYPRRSGWESRWSRSLPNAWPRWLTPDFSIESSSASVRLSGG